MKPENVTLGEWQVAVETARGDRRRLAVLVNAGTVRRVPVERNTLALVLPSLSTVNLAIRPRKGKGKRR